MSKALNIRKVDQLQYALIAERFFIQTCKQLCYCFLHCFDKSSCALIAKHWYSQLLQCSLFIQFLHGWVDTTCLMSLSRMLRISGMESQEFNSGMESWNDFWPQSSSQTPLEMNALPFCQENPLCKVSAAAHWMRASMSQPAQPLVWSVVVC